MKDNPWVSSQIASAALGVTEKTLQGWREIGYLKPGTHWKSADNSDHSPWKPEVIYHLRWCQEGIEYWRNHDAPIGREAA